MEMTKAQREQADRVAKKILLRGLTLADEEHMVREGHNSPYAGYERGSSASFSKGEIEYEVSVSSRRVGKTV